MNSNERKVFIGIVLVLVFISALSISAYHLISNFIRGKQEQSNFDKLSEIANENYSDDTRIRIEMEYPEALQNSTVQRSEAELVIPVENDGGELKKTFEPIYNLNHDFCGWLFVPNTGVSYPVMYTPEDPEYYLRRDFYKKESRSGTPFVGDGCTIDSLSLIVYGHNMKNGTMFSSLENYYTESFFKENPIVYFSTLEEDREYEVFSVVRIDAVDSLNPEYKYYQHVGDIPKSEYEDLVTWLTENSLFSTDIVPSHGEQLLILSTCSYHSDDGRLVIAARKLR